MDKDRLKIRVLSKTEQIVEYLRKQILIGELKPDNQVMSETKLAKLFGIGTITVRRAFSELEAEGLIYRIQGKGTFVHSPAMDKTGRLGVIVYHCDNPYYAKIIRSIENYANTEGYNIILCNSSGNLEKETFYISRIMSEVDGFLICPACRNGKTLSTGVHTLIAKKKPFVLMASVPQWVEKASGINYVIPDDFQSGYFATKHLIENGYQKIYFLAPAELLKMNSIHKRLAGCKKAIKENGLTSSTLHILKTTGDDEFQGYTEDGYKASEHIMDLLQEHSAVLCSGDSLAIGLLKGLKEHGVKVPEDVGVCGNDDIEIASHWGIELTTISHPTSIISEKSLEILLKNIRMSNVKMIEEHCVVSVKLHRRNTTEQIAVAVT
ncbi:MAG: GntR family transcriptional regulator [Candidatus Omnitrophica bacterium]|nr:GntR family transcriptional regulator [Candidatus Omnitrophota bacterium]